MAELTLCKATRKTKLFVPGQKLWANWISGACAAPVATRWKGKGRWIAAWAHWPDKGYKGPKESYGFFTLPDCRWVGRVEVDDEFFKKITEVLCLSRRKW